MVKLYGVIHNAGIRSFTYIGIPVHPSHGIITDLSRLPKGTRLGIEEISPEDLEFLKKKAKITIKKDVEGNHFLSYWDNLIAKNSKHQIVYLEDKDIWIEYLKLMEELENFSNKPLYHDENESDKDYTIKHYEYYNEKRRIKLLIREILEIKRDKLLLKSIRDKNVYVAIVGRGHSDYWISKNMEFESYSVDTLNQFEVEQAWKRNREAYCNFIENAKPDPSIVFERESLERQISLLRVGRLTERKADYVGTWDINDPTDGYFELFIEKNENGSIEGIIEDSLGTARITGALTQESFIFSKIYTENATLEAGKKTITYKARRQGDEFYGYWRIQGSGTPFYMIKAEKLPPLQMKLNWKLNLNLKN